MTERDLTLQPTTLSRSEYHQVVRAGLDANQFSFARQAALHWLAAYPGDLQMSFEYARALFAENRILPALQVLRGLCNIDPEFKQPIDLILKIFDRTIGQDLFLSPEASNSGFDQGQVGAFESSTRAHWFALNGSKRSVEWSAAWGGPLWLARKALRDGDLELAISLVDDLASQGPLHPYLGIIHLQILDKIKTSNSDDMVAAVKSYHRQYPDTIYFMLRLADWSIKEGQSDYAVALIHQAATRDIEGQVARRIWGGGHPFLTLWPDRISRSINIMLPAAVVARLSWNRLGSGNNDYTAPSAEKIKSNHVNDEKQTDIENSVNEEQLPKQQRNATDELILEPVEAIPSQENASSPDNQRENQPEALISQAHGTKEDFRLITREFEKLASKVKHPGITQINGLFPIYVVLSIRSRLQAVYGNEATGLIESEMSLLVEAVRGRPGWGAQVFFADDPASTLPIGAKPAKPDDPWGIKLAISDLDSSLEKRGERIGAILIVGGPEIVPFHHLPNPMDDPDTDVASDNPYATRGKNYFIPDWPVGRLPGGSDSDAQLILNSLRQYRLEHESRRRGIPWPQRLKGWITSKWADRKYENRRSIGYTAEIWANAARDVFSAIGNPKSIYVSPPYGFTTKDIHSHSKIKRQKMSIPAITGKMGYFNLHGVVDAVEWFGHRELLSASDKPDYPVALRPQDIDRKPGRKTPLIVFSEACFGAHVNNRRVDQAICLKFLASGCLAFVGSTGMAYGSIAAIEMVAGDLLGLTFWRFVKKGMTVGEALRQAKIYLASEMNRRQGYLDGEDQKTLISFVLYGDPLAEPIQKARSPKSIRYHQRLLAEVPIICDRMDAQDFSEPVPAEVMDGVRRVVAQYLPGMSDARMDYVCEHTHTYIEDPVSDSKVTPHQAGAYSGEAKQNVFHRSLVTLSKQIVRSGETHPKIARLTLDDKGNLIKLVVSR